MRSIVLIVLSLTLLFARTHAEDQVTRTLPLDQCIALRLEHNYDIRLERLWRDIAGFNLVSSDGVYEPSFNLNTGERFVKQPAGFDPKKSGVDSPYELTTDTLGMGISGSLPTGLTYDFQGNFNRVNGITDFSFLPSTANNFPPYGIRNTNDFVSTGALTLSQPLLRNFWIDAPRERIWVNRKNVKISEMALRWQIMNTVNAVQQIYYEMLFARERVKVQEHAL